MFWFSIVFLIAGIYSTVFGFRVLFQKGFVEKLREHGWREGNNSLFTKKEGYLYDKHVRGMRAFLSGLVFLAIAIYGLLNVYGLFK